VLPELTELIAWAAERAWSTLDPLIEELHTVTRYGRTPMWNLVADAILGPATLAPAAAGMDQRAGRAVGTALIDALIVSGAPIRRRGTAHPQWDGGRLTLAPVRGSCCLYFRQNQELCESCPLTPR
jgi:ferric iron reductase protein FhuF